MEQTQPSQAVSTHATDIRAQDAANATSEAQKKVWPFRIGTSASITRTITEADVIAHAQLSGDVNPLHLDDAFAKRTRFGRRIAHGQLLAGMISAVIGTKLPGPGAIFMSQSCKFLRPVDFGDAITATVTVAALREDKPIVALGCYCTNQRSEYVFEGEAVLLYEPV